MSLKSRLNCCTSFVELTYIHIRLFALVQTFPRFAITISIPPKSLFVISDATQFVQLSTDMFEFASLTVSTMN